MEHLTYKGEDEPLKPGIYNVFGKEYELISLCDCTSPLLHYILKDSRGELVTMQHKQIKKTLITEGS
jgi:hypothetical protein